MVTFPGGLLRLCLVGALKLSTEKVHSVLMSLKISLSGAVACYNAIVRSHLWVFAYLPTGRKRGGLSAGAYYVASLWTLHRWKDPRSLPVPSHG